MSRNLSQSPVMQRGFTLVELAISLMVIGLLLGGVLKGQEMIANGKTTATIKLIGSYDAAVAVFQSSYQALPGDIKNPSDRLPSCQTALCNIPGNGNNMIAFRYTHVTTDHDRYEEMYNFFSHMTHAGIIKSPPGGTTVPPSGVVTSSHIFPEQAPVEERPEWDQILPGLPIGDGAIKLLIYYRNTTQYWNGINPSPPGHYYQTKHFTPNEIMFTGKQLMAMDVKMDDGRPQTGDWLGGRCSAGNWASNVYDPKKECALQVRANF